MATCSAGLIYLHGGAGCHVRIGLAGGVPFEETSGGFVARSIGPVSLKGFPGERHLFVVD
jgi:hypothetical protein